MLRSKLILTFVFTMILFAGAAVSEASAQTRRSVSPGRVVVVQRPIVRRYYIRDPFWRYDYWNSGYYAGYYDAYRFNPYLRYQEQRYRLERELRGNERELAKHREKYYADGYLTPKEREELADDVRDVQRARADLERFLRYNRAYRY